MPKKAAEATEIVDQDARVAGDGVRRHRLLRVQPGHAVEPHHAGREVDLGARDAVLGGIPERARLMAADHPQDAGRIDDGAAGLVLRQHQLLQLGPERRGRAHRVRGEARGAGRAGWSTSAIPAFSTRTIGTSSSASGVSRATARAVRALSDQGVGLDRQAVLPVALVVAVEQRPGRRALEHHVDLVLPALERGQAEIGRAGDDPFAGRTRKSR